MILHMTYSSSAATPVDVAAGVGQAGKRTIPLWVACWSRWGGGCKQEIKSHVRGIETSDIVMRVQRRRRGVWRKGELVLFYNKQTAMYAREAILASENLNWVFPVDQEE